MQDLSLPEFTGHVKNTLLPFSNVLEPEGGTGLHHGSDAMIVQGDEELIMNPFSPPSWVKDKALSETSNLFPTLFVQENTKREKTIGMTMKTLF
jgi:hypothetical protein